MPQGKPPLPTVFNNPNDISNIRCRSLVEMTTDPSVVSNATETAANSHISMDDGRSH